ncbi:MAG: DegV family protein [Erysipelotrichia bacterium]|nr:DegV family protein [Erysipelotrichia bacterium]
MAIRLITDSASDITEETRRRLGIRVLPLSVTFGSETFMSGVNLTPDDFYNKLIESDSLPITSQVTPVQWTEAFSEIIAAGDTPLAITLSSRLSGTYQSACFAARELGGRAYVVDSMNACLGETILIEHASRLIEKGMNIDEICTELNQSKSRIRVIALLDTLEYLKKGGRISAASAAVGELLSLKPVIAVVDGEVKAIGKARGSKSGNNFLKELIRKDGGFNFDMPFSLAYSGLDMTLMNKYISDSSDIWKGHVDTLPMIHIGPTIGTHVGPGTVAVAWFSKNS